mgnify:CR=1 FL=1
MSQFLILIRNKDDIPLQQRLTSRKLTNKKGIASLPKWSSGNLVRNDDEIKFINMMEMPMELMQLSSPVQYFKFFMTKEILESTLFQTRLYSVQCCSTKPYRGTVEDLEQFIGMSLFMSIINLPATRHYWSQCLGHPAISEVMSCNKWEEIKRFIHFNDNETYVPAGQDGHDILHKIRPLLTKVRERLLLVPKEEYLAVDEQIIPTKSRSCIKQYNAKKPHKWGYKAFVLSGISGFSYDLEIFAGGQSNTIPVGAPDLGASSNVVARLVDTVP